MFKSTKSTNKFSEVKKYKVVFTPYKNSPGDSPDRGKVETTIKAYSKRNAITLAAQKLDINPINYKKEATEI